MIKRVSLYLLFIVCTSFAAMGATDGRSQLLQVLEKFENEYNLQDGTDYSRVTMSAQAWKNLIAKVGEVSTALADDSQADRYPTLATELQEQLTATDASLRLFKSYKAMIEGCQALGLSAVSIYASDSHMLNDARLQSSIDALGGMFNEYAAQQQEDFDASAFLGQNLNFDTPQGDRLTETESFRIYDIVGWDEVYQNLDQYCFIENSNADYEGKLYLRSNWTDKAVVLSVQKQRMLPAGKYKLSFLWNSNRANMTSQCYYKAGKQKVSMGSNSTTDKRLNYTVNIADSPVPFDLVFGFTKKNSGNTPAQIVVDDITLTYVVPQKPSAIVNVNGNGDNGNGNDNDNGNDNGNYTDLTGRSLEKPRKAGIYIKGGRKILVR